MKLFHKGDTVYVVKEGYVDRAQPDAGEPLAVTFDHIEDGLAYVRDQFGLTWEIPAGVICGVPEGHVFAMDLGSTTEANPCLVCGCQIIVPYRGPKAESEGRDA
jgi:hypothetical protein